ncbi:NmrA family protein [Ephemerocybe angulata]|uniref:NmrA family protein n=1 Tax=Ephemerocybe angulata TaxID=980116 RepID=A0A8H6M945_9AGAR|nr:NmrA family protein [Tulosesus angulatus]
MTTLITGGGSQTGIALAKLLRESGHPVLFGSRSGRVPDGYDSVKFDFTDPSTFDGPFAGPFAVAGHKVEYVYLLLSLFDPIPHVKPFIDLAVEKGVKRFVLLSSSSKRADKGPNSIVAGRVHTYLDEQGLDYVALRPTWFTENLLRNYGFGIKQFNVIQNSSPTARVPLVAVDDIASVAFQAIADVSKLPNREPILIGPDLLSYPESTAPFPKDELFKQLQTYGVPELFAQYLADIEEDEISGASEALLQDPKTIIGKVGAREWIEKHKDEFTAA